MGLFLSGGKGLSTRGAAQLLDTESTSNAWNVSPLKRGLRDRDRLGWVSSLVTNSILFCWIYTSKDRVKKVDFFQTHNQGFFLTMSGIENDKSDNSVLVSL